MKIKVNRAQLIGALNTRITELEKEDKKNENERVIKPVADYEKSCKKAIERMQKNLALLKKAKTVAALRALELAGIASLYFNTPSESNNQKTIAEIKSLLNRLRLSNEIEISADDKEEYLQYL